MELSHGIHLGYCTNIHRGETWEATFAGLRDYTMEVRARVQQDGPYGIGLRLSNQAAIELAEPDTLKAFQIWLDQQDSYVFTINGFPYGTFHGERVKEQVYAPDWTTQERLDYTVLLFKIISQLLPPGVPGSVSTLPGSFKEFIHSPDQIDTIQENLLKCCQEIETIAHAKGQDLHLGVEPEPLGLFETSEETLSFLLAMHEKFPEHKDILKQRLGVNYDTCHLAIEYEDPSVALNRLRSHGIRISKLHFSSALKVKPTKANIERLRAFEEDVYLHQVIARHANGHLERYRDLPPALEAFDRGEDCGVEWRVHFHVPLHCSPDSHFEDTRAHLVETMSVLSSHPSLCQHIEMETYTWEVLPPEMRSPDVVEQIVNEYDWVVNEMNERGLG